MTESNLKEKFREQGTDEAYLVREVLPSLGMYSSNPNDIRFAVCPLDKGLQISSRLYHLIIFPKEGEAWSAEIRVKDHVDEGSSQSDIFSSVYGLKDSSSKVRAEYEVKYLNAFPGPKLLAYDGNNRRLFLEKWDGSLDDLLAKLNKDNLTEQEQHAFASTSLERVVEMLVTNSKKATPYREQFSRGWLSLDERDPDTTVNKFKDFLVELWTYAQSQEKNGGNSGRDIRRKLREVPEDYFGWVARYFGPAVEEIREVADYLAKDLFGVQAVIHSDARSPNVLYHMKKKNGNDKPPELESLTMCDFVGVKVGPLSYDIISAVNDFHFRRFGKVTTDEARSLFDRVMMEEPSLWTGESDGAKLKEQLDKSFLFGTIADAIIRVGVPLLLAGRWPGKYNRLLTISPDETNRNIIETKMGVLLEVMNRYEHIKAFPRLKKLWDSVSLGNSQFVKS